MALHNMRLSVPRCSVVFRNSVECSGMFHRVREERERGLQYCQCCKSDLLMKQSVRVTGAPGALAGEEESVQSRCKIMEKV